MEKASWMALFTVGVLWSAAGCADDLQSASSDAEPLPFANHAEKTMLTESAYSSLWQSQQTTEALEYSDDSTQAIADFHFQNADALSRVSKLRSLSLLTLADFGQTRLFFGVNEHGVVGLHFNASPNNGSERYLEMVRMPYLKKASQTAE